MQRALMQFFKSENYFEVREALLKAGRADLIGSGCDCLIPANPPRAALRARMEKTNREVTEGRYVHTIDGPARPGSKPGANSKSKPAAAPTGYRPDRKTARRRPR
jgi:hypothetical protein